MKFKILWKWFDFWIGAYWDIGHRTLYICPLPTIVLRFEFSDNKDESKHRTDMTSPEILIAVAKLDGYEVQERMSQFNTRTIHFIQFAGQPIERKIVMCELPDYLNSRDAIIPVCEKQSPEIRERIKNRTSIFSTAREIAIILLEEVDT